MSAQHSGLRSTVTGEEQQSRIERLNIKVSSFPRVERLRMMNINADFSMIAERALIYTRVYKETEGEPEAIRRAKALAQTLREMAITIHPGERIVSDTSIRKKCAQFFPEIFHQGFYDELKSIEKREDSPLEISQEDIDILWSEVYPYWKEKNISHRFDKALPDALQSWWWVDPHSSVLEESKVPGTVTDIVCNTSDQSTIDYFNALALGFKGIADLARTENEKAFGEEVLSGHGDPSYIESHNFRKAISIVYEAAQEFIMRYARLAEELEKKESDPEEKQALGKIAEICSWIAHSPPRGFWEALQAVQFFMTISKLEALHNTYPLGRWDQYLYPYYTKDVEAGILSREEAQELVDQFFIKCADHFRPRPMLSAVMYGGNARWDTLCISGVKPPYGGDATNELSWMALQAIVDVRLVYPDVAVLYHRNIPGEFLKRACEVAALGTGHPKFYSHEALINQEICLGEGKVPIEVARTVCQTGCTEIQVMQHRSYSPSVSHGNMAGWMEFALNNGRGRMVDRQFGPKTGDSRQFKSFEEVVDAFRQQTCYAAKVMMATEAVAMQVRNRSLYCPFEMGTRKDLVEKGMDIVADCDKPALKQMPYNSGAFVVNGFADCAESLAAINCLVFKKKMISLEELIDALDADFEGKHARILPMIKNEVPHYGNDDDEADQYAEIVSLILSEAAWKYHRVVNRQVSAPDILSLTINVGMGSKTGALPSGKRAGMPNADASGPAYGYDRNGPTACVRSVGRSCCEVSHKAGMPNQNLLNIRLQPDLIFTEGGIDNWEALLKSYFRSGGTHIQFNLVDSDTLRDAQKKPEKYPDLLVRVAGYSAYFVTLAPVVQGDIINRTEYDQW